ncbi:MAG: sulfatase-like hydrolase/transferase [Planctomycetota bacterium]|nr:sulfatase-like hydrolase/transferase [Planctomycetota bacterium]
MPRPPNVLVLMSDQHRAEIAGCYGHPLVRTPHLDALAGRGTLFENAFCAAPLCGPSRAAAITGTYPHTCGLVTHPNGRHRLKKQYTPEWNPAVRSLVGEFRARGYRTHACGYLGVMGALPDGARTDAEFLGFESAGAVDYAALAGKEIARRYNLADIQGEMWEPGYFNVAGKPWPYEEDKLWDSLIAEDAANYIRNRDPAKPFYLYAGFRAVHPPWCAPSRFHELYDPARLDPLPDYKVRHTGKPRRIQERFDYFDIRHYPEDMVRRSIAAYYGFVSYLDDCIGRVLRALEEAGLRDETLIVYTADHGENLYRHGLCEKHSFFDGAVRIPLLLSGPGIPAGARREGLASNIDLLPTLLAASGGEVPGFVEGVDLRPLAAEGREVRERVFAEYYHTTEPCRMVRDRRWKYIHTVDDVNELYDLQNDPLETLNLAWYPQYAERVAAMDRLVLADWEVPDLPPWAGWTDLNERKQRQRLAGLPIPDTRPPLPAWAAEYRGG